MTPSPKPIVLIASDHAGTKLKALLTESLPEFEWRDLGPIAGIDRVDYPDYAEKLCTELLTLRTRNPNTWGILVCGSGVGMSIAANKVRGIRAALAFDAKSAELARNHNDANVLCLGERVTEPETAIAAARAFLRTAFSTETRHRDRLQKLMSLEAKYAEKK